MERVKLEAGGAQLGLGASNFSLPRTWGGNGLFLFPFSPPQIPKISLFWFVKCKKGVWERVVVRPLPTPHIPFLLTLPSVWEEADPEKWVMFPASPVHRGWLWLGAREKPKGPGTPSDREMGEGET